MPQSEDLNLKIAQELYLGDTFSVACNQLLGAYLCSNVGGRFTAGRITELEVYIGAEDKACHAYPNRQTPRNAVMFGRGGHAYVFFVYGMYHQFNVVTGPSGRADAVLIRALEPVAGTEIMSERRQTKNLRNLTTGPGKLCQALGITRTAHNGINLCGKDLWLSPRQETPEIITTPRIGIDYAGEYKDKPWRFLIKDNLFVSKR